MMKLSKIYKGPLRHSDVCRWRGIRKDEMNMKKLSKGLSEVTENKKAFSKNLKLLPNEEHSRAQVLQKGHNKQANEVLKFEKHLNKKNKK